MQASRPTREATESKYTDFRRIWMHWCVFRLRCSRSSRRRSFVANCLPTKPSTVCVGWLHMLDVTHRPVHSTTGHSLQHSTAKPTSERCRWSTAYFVLSPFVSLVILYVRSLLRRNLLSWYLDRLLVHLTASNTLPFQNYKIFLESG